MMESIPFRGHYTEDKYQQRFDWLTSKTKHELNHLYEEFLNPELLQGNIENYIGTVKIPTGIAGPLIINGDHAKGTFYAPFATTEGALLSSITRGSNAITAAGGVKAKFIYQKMIRGPLFEFASLDDAFKLIKYLDENLDLLRTIVHQVTNHGELISIHHHLTGKDVHVRFEFTTGDASGQNMTTAATDKICKHLLSIASNQEFPIQRYYIEGGFGGDKRTSYGNLLNGRGIKVIAEANIPEKVLKRYLKTSGESLCKFIQHVKNSSIINGSYGANINTSNVIAAIFAATGQDLGCVQESSVSLLNIELTPDGVYISIELPSLIIGTVGGGTGLPSQQDALKIMDCHGAGKVKKFAELIASFALALDLSTASAIASGQFASAHEKLGKNRPNSGIKLSTLNTSLINEVMNTSPNFNKIATVKIDNQDSILSNITSKELSKFCGHIGLRLSNDTLEKNIVLKAKPTDKELFNMISKMAYQYSPQLGELFIRHRNTLPFNNCTTNEIKFYETANESISNYLPEIFGLINLPKEEKHAILMEDLSQNELLHGIRNIKRWNNNRAKVAIENLCLIHRELSHINLPNEPVISLQEKTAAIAFYIELWSLNFGESATCSDHRELIEGMLQSIDLSFEILADKNQQVIHNDFNPRNICFNKNDSKICVYDWELIKIGNRWSDVIEFLSFLDQEIVSIEQIEKLIVLYSKNTDVTINWIELKSVMEEFIIVRLGLYYMAHFFKDYGFLDNVLKNATKIYVMINDNIK